MPDPSVLVVVVNYRSAGLAVDCLRSLEAEVAARPGTRVVVTDNASGDGSADALDAAVRQNGWGGWAEVRPLDTNGGFAFGNNAAIRPALASENPPDFVWLLNPDTVVRTGALSALLGVFEQHPDAGLVGSRLEHLDGTPQRSWFGFPSVLGEFESSVRLRVVSRALAARVLTDDPPTQATPVDWVAGASLMVRRAVFEAVGLLDETYFMYFEEVDFCLKARRAGWKCWYAPASRVVHLVGQSSGVTDPKTLAQKRRPAYWVHARRHFFVTNHGILRTFLADAAWASGFLLWRLRKALKREAISEPKLLFWDFCRFNFLMAKR
ncbi:MAG: glycosyltransferase family 2 protein [Isosphaeraceae bacterium]